MVTTDYPVREALYPTGFNVLYVVLVPIIIIFFYGLYIRTKLYASEAIREILRNPRSWIKGLWQYAILQSKILSDKVAGVMHIMISYGILVLLIGTILIFIEDDILKPLFGQSYLRGYLYLFLESVLDFFGLLFVVGICVALIRRHGLTKRLRKKWEYFAYLYGLLFVGVSGFILEGLRLYLKPVKWASYSLIGSLISVGFKLYNVPTDLAQSLYSAIWWAHAAIALTLIATLPYTNLFHVIVSLIYSGLSYLGPNLPTLAKTPIRLEDLEKLGDEELKIGFKRFDDLNWYQKMGLDACTDCGRCEAECPAYLSGTKLSPRMLNQRLKAEMRKHSLRKSVEDEQQGSIFNVVEYDEVFACTTCAWCVEVCPVTIRPLEYILNIRRAMVFEGEMHDERAVEVIKNLNVAHNPYGLPISDKEKAIEEFKKCGAKTIDEHPHPEYIYWIGCAATYDDRARNIAKKMIEILTKAGVDFAIIGHEEMCCGEPARRIGEEGIFQEIAYRNIEILKSLDVKKIITHCPHCFQILKNEYPEFGLEGVEVFHHTQILEKLVSEGKLRPQNVGTVTLHDSCYIARINGIVDEPRRVLNGLELREMKRRGKKTFCCGGGGGNYWYSIKRLKRENIQRLEEALGTGASVVITECPFCLAMLEDAVRFMDMEGKIKVYDICELF